MSQELQNPTPPPVQSPRPARPTPGRTPQTQKSPPSPRSRQTHHSRIADVYPEEADGFFTKHKTKLIVAGVLVVAAGMYFVPKPKAGPAPRKAEQIVQVVVPPPPLPKPPPPPPPQKIEPPKEKMEKETQVEAPKDKPAPKAPNPPPTALATGIKGEGPGVGLGSSGSGLGGGTQIGGPGTGGNNGSKWGWYAGQVQAAVKEALHKNTKTRSATISGLQVRIWPDASGRVTRATLASSTGDKALDSAIEHEVLGTLQLQQPPPAGMNLPIVLRLTERPR